MKTNRYTEMKLYHINIYYEKKLVHSTFMEASTERNAIKKTLIEDYKGDKIDVIACKEVFHKTEK